MKGQLYINESRNMTRYYLKAHMSLLFSRLLKGGHVYVCMYIRNRKRKRKRARTWPTLNCDVSMNVMYRSYTGEVFGSSKILRFCLIR